MRFKGKGVLLIFAIWFKLAVIPVYAQQNDTTKPWVLWHWIHAGVSKPGITADLEAMKSAGIGGAYLLSIKGADNPPIFNPPSVQLTPQWWDMVTFAMQEAKRLNLKLGMHVSDGFALAGGPWITPELSMQKVVSTRLNIKEGLASKIKLEQPETKEGYYKDIAVYAYPSPEGTGISTRTMVPTISTSNGLDASGLVIAGNKKSFGSNEPCWFQYAFAQPFTTRSITIKTGGNNYQAQRLEIQVSDDGKAFRSIGRLDPPRQGWQDTDADYTHSMAPVTARYYRFIYDKRGSEPGSEDLDAAKWKPSLKLLNLELSAEARINQFEGKSAAVWRISKRSTAAQLPDQICVPLNKIIDLTAKLNADGSLNWKAPKGNWTILRIGHTSTGHTNATGGGGKGLECDKFNPVAVKLQFDSWYGEALKRGGPEIASKVMTELFIDSWECGSQNWSSLFASEFKKRRGYDLMPYLPVMSGIPVQSAAISEEFLYDLRKTIAELVVDQFYKTIVALAKEKGVNFSAESVAPTMISDGLMHYKAVDVPMGEFWLNSPTHDKPNDMMDAISGAHIYGKNIIQAEAFTSIRMDWSEHPGNMKTLLDRNYALGINKMVYHVFAHNPWMDRKPGMTLDGIGLYFQRDQTWWKPGKAWVNYAERVQTLLQQGDPVIDIAVFTGNELPRRSVLPDRLVSVLPGIFGKDVVESERLRLLNTGEPLRIKPMGVNHSANMADSENWVNSLRGYAYDSFNPDVLSTAVVRDKKVVFSSGASYGVLVIPGKTAMDPNYQYMDFEIVKQLLALVKAGATVLLNEKPLYQSGLKQVPETEFKKAVDELWVAGKNGDGQVLIGPYQEETFKPLGLERDLFVAEAEQSTYAKYIAYTHRKTDQKDIYFIANQLEKDRVLNCSFRIADLKTVPEFYDAVSGKTWKARNWSVVDGRLQLAIKLDANASVFVIFDRNTDQTKPVEGKSNWSEFTTTQVLDKDWQVTFDPAYGGPSKPVLFKDLTDWSLNQDSLIRYYSGTAIYNKNINIKSKKTDEVWLDLGAVANIADVKINNVSCGIVWTPPYRVEISKALRNGNNQISIELSNTWANRLIGDQRLPENKRITKTNAPYRLEGKPLLKAGLLGPVTIQTIKYYY
ncbi:F5/8 type C domain-containing protein [Pedobacter sp. ok626]|uniref:glycosyl hydrolase n=1 Tax=Pedobacter sp. ok626 TaxID=1761882 RepID=UPI00088A754D|nr:glycosyl hydrolase [Pedobacter sp. ok626]SDJ09095.1 F5/8 type C domain-containing protein [Pedobacter sp. ok626]